MTDRRLTTRLPEAELAAAAQITPEDRVLAQLSWREKATLKLLLDAAPVDV